MSVPTDNQARRLHIGGVVQGVGFRPFVYRLATARGITGWVCNGETGVEIHAQGSPPVLDAFAHAITAQPPPAAQIATFVSENSALEALPGFEIRRSEHRTAPSTRVSADLPVCRDCLRELFDPDDRRYGYPYINCTNCGPRYSIVRGLPYDRPQTTMRDWPMCEACRREYEDPADRRFHAQPIACVQCGPQYALESAEGVIRGTEGIAAAARALCEGRIVAVKGIGGYHLACDARNEAAVRALRERKYRKERPFAVMVRDTAAAKAIVHLTSMDIALLESSARPIVLLPAQSSLALVAPGSNEIGVMLAYTPVHHLLFAAGAPNVLVMTSANRSSEPIAYRDDDARQSLHGIADAMLVGEREIARRIDDSVISSARFEGRVLRRARGYAPHAVATLPAHQPILALGADLKNAIGLVVSGQAFASQHIGDLDHYDAFESFKRAVTDMCALYELQPEQLTIAHDAHPQYRSSEYAAQLPGNAIAVQHHRAHIASVLAERGAFDASVIGFAFDGTGYGDDGSIWGGEVFAGALASGFERVAHLRSALLPGGDAAAYVPIQAAAGFLYEMETPDLCAPPFNFPHRYRAARELLRTRVRVFATTSMGRLFDTVAALLGFTRAMTFEGQAAMWLEQIARGASTAQPYPFPFDGVEFDYRPLLENVIRDRTAGRDIRAIALAFHLGLARAVVAACNAFGEERVVVSGGVFQNALLLEALQQMLGSRLWTNRSVPANDGGICLGQAAIAAFAQR